MAYHIITADGLALVAENEDLYTVVPGFDGKDYMLVLHNGKKVFQVHYFGDDEETADDLQSSPLAPTATPLSSEEFLSTIVVCHEGAQKKKGSKKKQIKHDDEDVPVQSPAAPTQDKEDPPKKKIIMLKSSTIENATAQPALPPKAPEVPVPKKLSAYHMFIKAFLAEHNDIPWNLRMKAANAAWKEAK